MRSKETFAVRIPNWDRARIATLANRICAHFKVELSDSGFDDIDDFTINDDRLTRDRCIMLLTTISLLLTDRNVEWMLTELRTKREGSHSTRYDSFVDDKDLMSLELFTWIVKICAQEILDKHTIEACLVHRSSEVQRLARIKLGIQEKRKKESGYVQ